MKVTMLRNPAHKPDEPAKNRRHEGETYTVPDKEGRRLIAEGVAVDPSAPPPEADAEADTEAGVNPDGDGLDAMTVADLRDLAARENVPLHGQRKTEIVEAIRDARSKQ